VATKEKLSAQTLSPGAHLALILQEQGMKQAELAAMMGRPPQYVHDIIKGKKSMDARVAVELEEALSTPTASQWLEWELEHQRFLMKQDLSTRREASLKRRDVMDRYPFAVDAVRFDWIPDAKDPSVLLANIEAFLAQGEHNPSIAFRTSEKVEGFKQSLKAWTIQAYSQVAQPVHEVPRFDREHFVDLLRELEALMPSDEGIEAVPGVLRKYGIRFTVLASIRKAPVDGIASLNGGQPFIVLSLRHGQIDRFWFVLMHELAHIYLGHEPKNVMMVLDNYDDRNDRNPIEREADAQALDWLWDQGKYHAFVNRYDFTLESIHKFAVAIGRHPAMVIGRLKADGWLPYHMFAREHPSIRESLTKALK
jgi:HTH-type transcriptional regulator / antitoxin HigA